MAMLHLMARAAPLVGGKVRAVTVDHRLRPEAADEARFVAGICAALGVPHDTLVWDHGVIAGNLMDQASRARYGLIADWAKQNGMGHVALAHTATDQAETFLMGLARQSGLDGLSGMRPQFAHQDVIFFRPFLMQSRMDLRGYLTRNAMSWVDDPTNENDDYTRVKARRILQALAPLGITSDGIARSVQHLARAQNVVQNATTEAALRVASEEVGALRLDGAAFGQLAPELQRKVLVQSLLWLSAAPYAPRALAIEKMLGAIAQTKETTLAGCRLRHHGTTFILAREPAAVGGGVGVGQIWDRRWVVSGPRVDGAEVRALGHEGLLACKNWRDLGLPREALHVTPAVWQADQLIAAPLANPTEGWSARVSQSFKEFILSH